MNRTYGTVGQMLGVCTLLFACSNSPASSGSAITEPAAGSGGLSGGSGGAPAMLGGTGGKGGGPVIIDIPPEAGSAGTGGAPIKLTDLVKTEVGGYQRGDEILPGGVPTPSTAQGNDGCGVIVGVVRDFQTQEPDRHPDFEIFSGSAATTGLVSKELDSNRKPVYASKCEESYDPVLCPMGQQTTSQANFDQWYRDTPGINHSYLLYFELEPVGNIVSFQSENFVPVDGAGFKDNVDGLDGLPHNYGFTTELHLKFKYSGGETFTFKGDDDVWVFINGHLALDLGGLHSALQDSIQLDDLAGELGITKGNVYPLELFHAERHSNGSHFRIDSTLSFVDCGSIPIVR